MASIPVDIKVVYAFVYIGNNIININDRYYKYSYIQEPTNSILKMTFKGRDITDILANAPQISLKGDQTQINSVAMTFIDVPEFTITCNKDVPYTTYTR